MNKRELIDEIADELGGDVTKQDVERTLEAFTRVVGASLRQGEPVQMVGFGTFEPRKRPARTARNPQTGESVEVPATTSPAFKAGQPLKDYVGGKSGAAERFKGPAASKKAASKKAAGKKAAGKKAAGKKAAGKKAAGKKAAGKKVAGKKATTAGKATAKKSAKAAAKSAKTAKRSAKGTKKSAKKSAKKTGR